MPQSVNFQNMIRDLQWYLSWLLLHWYLWFLIWGTPLRALSSTGTRASCFLRISFVSVAAWASDACFGTYWHKWAGSRRRDWGFLRSTGDIAVLHHLDLEGALNLVQLLALDPTIGIILWILACRLAIDFIIINIIIRRGVSYNKIKQVDMPTFWVLRRIIIDFLSFIYLIQLLFLLDRLEVLSRAVVRWGDGIKWATSLE